MTHEQFLSMAVLAVTLGLFIWDRLRYDVVALISLLAAIATGVVPMAKAFTGFSDQIVVVVASALVISKALSLSGTVERLLEPLAHRLTTTNRQAAVLVGAVTALSAFMKNIGALAIFMPVALQFSRRIKASPSRLMMPLAFGSLLGGVMTLIGTSPNIIVSRVREDLTGHPFSMFDFFPVGAGIAVTGLIFLIFGWRLLPERRSPTSSAEGELHIRDYLTEVRLLPNSPLVDGTVGDLEALSGGAVTVAALIRDKGQRYIPGEHWRLLQDDIIIVETDPENLKKLLTAGKLEIATGGGAAKGAGMEPWEELVLMETVVAPSSPLIGCTIKDFRLRSRFGVNVLALGRGGRQFVTQLRQIPIQVGDVMVVQGPGNAMATVLADLACLPLAYRNLAFDKPRRFNLAVPILMIAILLISLEVVTVAVGFFAAAVIMVVTRHLSLREAYEAIDWPILVMLGALIPVSDGIQSTGASDLIAGGLASLAVTLPAEGTVVMMLVAAMLLTPFLNNAATVLVMAPIAASLAQKLGLNADPLLMAVAIGAACDFLTPIGHQCNTLVMGPGGYKFGDYWRLGLPLSIMVVVMGSSLLLLFWPLK
jgi:di/tricarboxylate transporter